MTDRHSLNRRGSSNLADTAKWVNTSGETVPAYGVVQFKANFASGYSQASKPDGVTGLYFANGPVAIADTKSGESLMWNRARLVLLDGSPVVGTVVGPVEDSWAMSEEGTGFVVMHQAVDGVGSVLQVGGGDNGSVSIWFTIEAVLCPDRDYVTETTLVVTVERITGECGGVAPGADYYGVYHVYAYCANDLMGLTEDDLIGTKGKATYSAPVEGYCDKKYLIDYLCAQPECP